MCARVYFMRILLGLKAIIIAFRPKLFERTMTHILRNIPVIANRVQRRTYNNDCCGVDVFSRELKTFFLFNREIRIFLAILIFHFIRDGVVKREFSFLRFRNGSS